MSVLGLASAPRSEHDVKPPVCEEELGLEVAVPESLRCRLLRHRTRAQASMAPTRLTACNRAPRTRCEVLPRRLLDKQNGIGAFLRC